MVKNLPTNAGHAGFDPWIGKILWRRKWQPTPVFLPGKSHGQKSLMGYNPWGRRVGHDLATKQQQGGSLDGFLDFSSFLIYALNAILFPLSTVFSVSHKLW